MADNEYDFPREFQRRILALLLCDRDAMATLRDAVAPEYFTDESYRWVLQAAYTVFDAARALPGQPSVLTAALEDCPASLDEVEIEAEIRSIYEDGKPEDADYVRGKVIDFARCQRLRAAAAEAEELLERGEYDRFVQRVNEASIVGVAQEGDDMVVGGADSRAVLLTMDEMYGGMKPTGIRDLDARLDGGGLGAGEMGIILGLPGFHKTNILVNIGIGGIANGLRVAHFSLENNRKRIVTRYHCAMTDRAKSEVLMNPEATLRDVDAFMERTGGPGRLRISYYPKNTCSLAMLEAKLKRWEAFGGWRPDVIVVDYGKVMKPIHDFDNTFRLQVAANYSGLGQLAGTWNAALWTAQQADRASFEGMSGGGVMSMKNAAETFEPVRDADVLITANQTASEKQEGVLRLHGAKVRESEGGWTISVRIDAAKSRITPLVEDLPAPPARRKARPPEPSEDD